jgi:protein-S-isoprenylcysteine O-methyltransferase Ste14
VGLGIASDILWWTVLSVPLAAAMQHWLIVPEERYLLTRFGAGYAAYQQRVRRWL